MTKPSIEYIANGLKAARKMHRLSQRSLGEKINVPQSHISKIESGNVDIATSSLVEFARALDLDVLLVPRTLVPAVQSLIRSHNASALSGAIAIKAKMTGALSDAPATSKPAYTLDEENELS